MIAGVGEEVTEESGLVQLNQFPQRGPGNDGKAAVLFGQEKFFSISVPKGLNHGRSAFRRYNHQPG